jgi:hypothetical protein
LPLPNAVTSAHHPPTAPLLETADFALKAPASIDAKVIPLTSLNSSLAVPNAVILALHPLIAHLPVTADFASMVLANTGADY